MVSCGITGFKLIKLPPKNDAGDTARKPLKPLCTIHIVCALHEQQCTIPHVQNKSEKCKFILR